MEISEVNSNLSSNSRVLLVINLGNKVSTMKLNNDNFLLWKFQVEFALKGHGLLETHIDENLEPPSCKLYYCWGIGFCLCSMENTRQINLLLVT